MVYVVWCTEIALLGKYSILKLAYFEALSDKKKLETLKGLFAAALGPTGMFWGNATVFLTLGEFDTFDACRNAGKNTKLANPHIGIEIHFPWWYELHSNHIVYQYILISSLYQWRGGAVWALTCKIDGLG